MPGQSTRSKLYMSSEERVLLESLSRSRTAPRREVLRATILLLYSSGLEISKIAPRAGTSRPSVYKCIDKALAMGVKAGLKDTPHSPGKTEITLEAKAWVTSLACSKPRDLGFAAEVWSRRTLADYVRAHAEEAGHSCLKSAAKATIQRILKENKLQPQNIKYYLEKRDPDFDDKMREVLIVYREVLLQNEQGRPEDLPVITVCVDEKPGVQAIENTAPDLPPVPGKHSSIGRDHEYIRHGTASILAGIDLHDGHVFAQVQRRHRSVEFIELLKEIDRHYPTDKQIRIILDNHSSHISKETRAYLATRPNRFIYVHTPKHGSWLNLAETLFGKMARTFLIPILAL
jgi:transposase